MKLPLPTPMKTPSLSQSRPLALASLLVLGALALPIPAHAKPDKKAKSSKKHDKKAAKPSKGKDFRDRRDNHDRDNDHGHDRDERVRYYHARPRTTFSLNLGTGYAGRGYYYGPPNVPYYYERSDVRYYRTREAAPREYWGQDYSNRVSVEASVQQALARKGYYRGGIDGEIGPYSQSCIARYQEDHGLRPTGQITQSLLRSLDLE